MYEEFFALARKPFELVPNPEFIYLSRSHQKAEMYLNYALRENAGFILLTGEVGSGKTTLVRQLLQNMGIGIQVAKVFNTNLTTDQLLETINDDFGLEVTGRSKTQLLKELYDFLIGIFARQNRAVLIIDEAQNLTVAALEELRMLSNLETNDSKLMQIILVGQPELRQTLALPELRQLRQRISIHCHLLPLTERETVAYIGHRLTVAGGGNVRFSDGALTLIHQASGGIPRLVNILCDFLLLSAFAEGSRQITEELVLDIAADPQFEGQFHKPVRPRPAKKPTTPPAAKAVASSAAGEEALHHPDIPVAEAVVAVAAGEGGPKGPPAPVQANVEDFRRQLDAFSASLQQLRLDICGDPRAVPVAVDPRSKRMFDKH
jgi:general secretion pathway protein A